LFYGEATWSRTRALARFNEDGTTTIDLARAFRADDSAKNAHLQGAVKLSIVVGANGMVQDVTVVQSLGKGLDEKAMEAVRHWKYLPAMKNRQPVETQVDVVVSFKLD